MIVVSGASCCLPGGVETINEFWQVLCDGENMISDVPEDRWNSERFFHPDASILGKTYMQKGHFIKRDITEFDYDALRISKREAEGLDPQQRLLLELTWQGIENSGLAMDNLPSRKVGVYIGGFTLDHFLGQFAAENRHAIGVHTASGSTLTMLSNRISHTFDFQGPSLTIDTACSSSLVAFHYACEDLKSGACDIAVVGGVNLMSRPEYPIGMAKGGFLAKDGRSKSFDITGDGYGRGEGGVVLILRRKKDVESEQGNIIAEYVASGVNQDGRTPGITLPSPQAQIDLMQDVLTRHNIDPNEVAYVEAHGTGTAAGDPIEAASINTIYGERDENNLCYIGSAKSNFGHLEAASGVVGILKAALVAKNKVIPPIAGFTGANPNIKLTPNKVALAEELTPLLSHSTTPMVAINSFGYGGTNAHVLLQHYAEKQPSSDVSNETSMQEVTTDNGHVLLLTAASKISLSKRVEQALALLQASPENANNIVQSFVSHCSLSKERACFVASSTNDLITQLCTFAQDENPANETCIKAHKKIGFIYTGMGPQWHGMGKELWENNVIYQAEAKAFDQVFQQITGFSILDEMLKSEADSRIEETEFAQPANLLMQVALTATLRHYGIEPHAVTGHSVGDVTASYISGCLSLEDAIKVSVERSQLQGTLRGRGGMLAAAINEETALSLINDIAKDNVSIAAINSPTSVTLAGDSDKLEKISALLTENDIFNRLLAVEVPYHSRVMDEIHDEIHQRLGNLTPLERQVPCYSTVTGAAFNGPFDSTYWNANVRQAVRFCDAINAMIDDGINYFIEVGPHPVLSRSLVEIFKQHEDIDCLMTHTLKRNTPEESALSDAVKHVFQHSNAFVRQPLTNDQRIELPAYPWDRKQVWSETEQTKQDRCGKIIAPMLERQGNEAGDYITDLSLHHLDYLKSHVVDGNPVIPAAAIIEAVLEAGIQSHPGASAIKIANARFMRTLSLDNTGEQFLLRYQAQQGNVSVLGATERKAASFKTKMATMTVKASQASMTNKIAVDCSVERDIPSLYSMFNDVGLHSDELFQTVNKLSSNADENQLWAEVIVDSSLSCDGYAYHPTLIDGVFQATAAFISDTTSAFIPVGIEEIIFKIPKVSPRKVIVTGSLSKRNEDTVVANLCVCDSDNGQVLIQLLNLEVKRIKELSDEQLMPMGNYQIDWQPSDDIELLPAQDKQILFISDENNHSVNNIADLLNQDGAHVQPITISQTDDNGSWLLNTTQQGDLPLNLDNKAVIAEYLSEYRLSDIVLFANLTEKNPVAAAEAFVALVEAIRLYNNKQEQRVKLTVFTENGMQVTGDEILSAQSGAIAGAQRVVWSEADDVAIQLIDVDSLVDFSAYQGVSEILNSQNSDEVAYRAGQRYSAQVINFPTEINSRLQKLTAEHDYRWFKSGQTFSRELLTNEPVQNNQAVIKVELTGFGDKNQFAKKSQTVPNLVIGRQEFVNESGASARSVVDVTLLTDASIVQPQGQSENLITLNEHLPAEQLMSASLNAWAQLIVERYWLNTQSTIMVSEHSLGQAIAIAAKVVGANVVTVNSNDWSNCLENNQLSFDLIAVPVTAWLQSFDFNCLITGGKVVNLDSDYNDELSARYPMAISELAQVMPLFSDKLSAVLIKPINSTKIYPQQNITEWANLTAEDISTADILDWRVTKQDTFALPSAEYQWDRSNWMLITGGLGGIGEKFLNWLDKQSMTNVLIVGRSNIEKIQQNPTWKKLENKGMRLRYISADITSESFVDQLTYFNQKQGKITTVAHLAGIIDDSPLSDMGSEAFANVINVKALGLNHVLTAIPAQQLHTVLTFSSIALITGNSRQANYCAANHYIENQTRNLRHQGINALVIHTGAISDVGMIQRDKRLRQHIDNTGLSLISTANLFVGIKHALIKADSVVTAAGEPNWEKWSNLEVLAARSPRFNTVLADVGNGSADIYETLRRDLAQADAEVQQNILVELMKEAFSPVLRLESEAIASEIEFSDLGIDSLMAAEVQSSLKNLLGLDISILTLISESQSLRKLADIEITKMKLGV